MPHRFNGERTLMRILIGESDKYHGTPLYEALLEHFRTKRLAGATVLRGVAGFGAESVVHKEKVLRLSLDLSIVIEVVETEEAIPSARGSSCTGRRTCNRASGRRTGSKV